MVGALVVGVSVGVCVAGPTHAPQVCGQNSEVRALCELQYPLCEATRHVDGAPPGSATAKRLAPGVRMADARPELSSKQSPPLLGAPDGWIGCDVGTAVGGEVGAVSHDEPV